MAKEYEWQTILGQIPSKSNQYRVITLHGHGSLARTHIVEISPASVFEEDSFRRWDSETIKGFIRLCPEENLCVTTEDDIMPIDEFVEFVKEKEGKDSQQVP